MIHCINHSRAAAAGTKADLVNSQIGGWLIASARNQGGTLASMRQIEANRANAEKSTGPRTSVGKAISSRNAYQHGLSRWNEAAGCGFAVFDAVLADEFKRAGMEAALQDLAQARDRQNRLRAFKLALILAVIEGAALQMKVLARLERYEKAALSRQRRGLKRVKGNNG